ncbi:hypothetical protein [Natranaeroarchaeum sulfidigenes]|uniref:Uncharacterized protein n=1 Tax=Natranaeroarchaeum sulfidigenes TaxID=2784880 RepID=A0A897MR62_9EURY|nr:hypothetical protein [Natranaeroarchaeum sulfidigenes]QSG02811.1 hypothetical protein AArcS_1600 [Natranaeroarchaeum sulfidigenes]
MIRDRLISEVQESEVAYMYDPRENSRWGLLRALPALCYLGVDDFTYPTSWCQFGRGDRHFELDYDYHVISNSLDIPDDSPDFGVITNDYYEEETPYTIKYLIDRYTRSDSMLFALTDSKQFQPQGAKRPLYQDPFVEMLGTYGSVYEEFEAAYQEYGWELPLTNTKNLFVQDNANLYRFVTGESLSKATELFEVLPEAPYLPLYDPLTSVFSRPEEFGTVPLDAEEGLPELVRWLRRRIEWDRDTARDIASSLNKVVISEGSTFDPAAARRHPSIREARQAAKNLDPEASPIDHRYAEWLTRYEL